MYLVPTGVTRSSTNILSSLDIDKIHNLMGSVNNIDNYIIHNYPKGKLCLVYDNNWVYKILN